MNDGIIKLTDNFSIAPEIRDPGGFALYDANGGVHAWMNDDLATFSDGDEFTVKLDKRSHSIVLSNVTQNISHTINY
jgi:hypothetical protein